MVKKETGGGEQINKNQDTFISAAAVVMTARRRSVCDEEWVRKRHLSRQALSKHLSLPLRQREMARGGCIWCEER